MGRVVNSGNVGFAKMLTARYVDKTGLIGEFDSTMYSKSGLVLSARPCRFGKGHAALALAAFYGCGCDSRRLFDGLRVSRRDRWGTRLNACNVIRPDMTGVMERAAEGVTMAGGCDVAPSANRGKIWSCRLPRSGSRRDCARTYPTL